ncbi:unnamed protein product [Vicia faba]|uniref:Major facilitator superfamily (MFS) profile domain-containing protein n=1 Tax=Vicia faba TaxID=3906 RepID=A0AAV0YLH3_VICFA|nr:unnamed protein product [Vicia faba]
MAGQLGVLNALDVAKTQMYHFTAIVIAGMDYTKAKPGVLPPGVQAGVTGVALVGTLAGQLFFGWLGDKLGRKKVYGMTLMLMVLAWFWNWWDSESWLVEYLA